MSLVQAICFMYHVIEKSYWKGQILGQFEGIDTPFDLLTKDTILNLKVCFSRCRGSYFLTIILLYSRPVCPKNPGVRWGKGKIYNLNFSPDDWAGSFTAKGRPGEWYRKDLKNRFLIKIVKNNNTLDLNVYGFKNLKKNCHNYS